MKQLSILACWLLLVSAGCDSKQDGPKKKLPAWSKETFEISSAINRGDAEALRRLLRPFEPDPDWQNGATLLHHAASLAKFDCVKVLVEEGADVNRANENGLTALHLVCAEALSDDHEKVIRFLVGKVQDETERSATLALEDVYGRVAATLRREAREENGILITGRLTHQDLAQIVGSSREMVSRIFKDLRQGGYIEVQNKRVIIKKKLPPRW